MSEELSVTLTDLSNNDAIKSVPRPSVSVSVEQDLGDDNFYPQVADKKKYARINLDDIDYRPAALYPFPTIVKQIIHLAHSEIVKHGCQRLLPEKAKPDTEHGHHHHHSHHKKRASHLKIPHENMDRKLNRLKIYRRAFGSLVIYFRAYSPILFHIKRAYDDVLRFRLKQFNEAQHEKIRIFHERASVEHKMIFYKFPDFKRLQKAQQYLNLLFVRIRKQDEAIQFITEILSKMERSLSDHYEKYRDMEDQIKMLDSELSELIERNMIPKKAPEISNPDENKDEVPSLLKGMEDEISGDEEPINENEEFDEDKRMVLMLAYAVVMKDLEEAQRKLKLYEKKYQLIQLRKRMRYARLHGGEMESEDALEETNVVEIEEETEFGDGELEDEMEEEMSDEEEEEGDEGDEGEDEGEVEEH